MEVTFIEKLLKYHFCGVIEFSYRTLIFWPIRIWIWDLRFWHCAWLLGLVGYDTMWWDEQVLSVWGETVISAFRRIRWTNQIYPNVDTNLPNYMVSHSVHLFWKNVELLIV